jgi:hypothetical protein
MRARPEVSGRAAGALSLIPPLPLLVPPPLSTTGAGPLLLLLLLFRLLLLASTTLFSPSFAAGISNFIFFPVRISIFFFARVAILAELTGTASTHLSIRIPTRPPTLSASNVNIHIFQGRDACISDNYRLACS